MSNMEYNEILSLCHQKFKNVLIETEKYPITIYSQSMGWKIVFDDTNFMKMNDDNEIGKASPIRFDFFAESLKDLITVTI